MLEPSKIEREVLEFFFVFSRFEFALKESGYVKASDRYNTAAPAWKAFVRDYREVYRPSDSAKEAVDYLMSQPPQRQKVHGEDVESLRTKWEPFPIDETAPPLKTLVDVVKTVRNNLFHGGKYGDKGWDDETRVSLLLTYSTNVVRDWLQLNNDLNVYYNDWA